MISPRRALLAMAFAAAAIALSPAPPASAQVEIRLNKIDSYFPNLGHKKEINRAYRDKVGKLREELHRRQLAGEGLACSAQILPGSPLAGELHDPQGRRGAAAR